MRHDLLTCIGPVAEKGNSGDPTERGRIVRFQGEKERREEKRTEEGNKFKEQSKNQENKKTDDKGGQRNKTEENSTDKIRKGDGLAEDEDDDLDCLKSDFVKLSRNR